MDDPEVAALLDFDPVPRKREVEGGWTPELQREFIVRLSAHGSATKACDEMGKNQTGVMKLYRSPYAGSFRAAWDGAVALAKAREADAAAMDFLAPGAMPPTIDHRFKARGHQAEPGDLDLDGAPRQPGQAMNECGVWEDEDSLRRRGEDAKDSIAGKLLRIRRLYLQEISGDPGKRAAFEILTELPVDWDVAAEGGAQADEPYRRTNQRDPDMVLLAESGWSMGEIGYGPDRKAQAQAAIDRHRLENGQEPIDWSAE
jgi:hypothetical protein